MNHELAISELRAAMARLEPEPEHTGHVAFLATRLFDDLAPLHGLGADERVILEGAACLHDVGWAASKSGSAHHKHSARIIRAAKWKQLGRTEVELVAQTARYHRKALPREDHEEFAALPAPLKEVVRKLAALLRIADGLDRSHLQHVRNVRARIEPARVTVTLDAATPPVREMAGALRKSDLARDVFGREFVFDSTANGA